MIEEGGTYISRSGAEFVVDHIARHGQDCSHVMIVYHNVEPTIDSSKGTIWVISETIFMNRFILKDGYPDE